MFQTLIDAISDFATLLAQSAVGFIADRSNIKKDGPVYFLVKIVVSAFVYLGVVIGVPLLVLALIFKFVLPFLLA